MHETGTRRCSDSRCSDSRCSDSRYSDNLTAFYHASSALAVYAMVVCLSVRLCVRHKSEFY